MSRSSTVMSLTLWRVWSKLCIGTGNLFLSFHWNWLILAPFILCFAMSLIAISLTSWNGVMFILLLTPVWCRKSALLYFLFHDSSNVSVGSAARLWLGSHVTVIDVICSLSLSYQSLQGLLWKRSPLDGNIWCSKTCTFLSPLKVLIVLCRLPNPEALMFSNWAGWSLSSLV